MDTRNNRIVWWILLSTVIVYGVVAYWIAPIVGPRGEAPIALIAGVLGAVSLSTAAGSVLLRSRVLVARIQSGELDLRTREGTQRATAPYVVCLALAESVGLIGLVLALLSGDASWALPFLALSLVLLIVHRPTASELQAPRGGPHAHLDSRPIG